MNCVQTQYIAVKTEPLLLQQSAFAYKEMPDKQFTPLKTALIFLSVFSLGLILRLLFHLNGPLYYDEVCSWAFARRTPFMNMWVAALSDPTPPLYYALLHVVVNYWGDSPVIMRLPSVLFGTLMLPVMYWMMRAGSFSKRDSLYAMLLGAVSSMLVYYSQEIRAYMQLAFFGVLSVGLLFRCLHYPTLINNLLYGITLFIVSYTHRYGLILVGAQILPLILYKRWHTLLVYGAASFLILALMLLQIVQGSFYLSDAIDRGTSFGAVIALINMLNVGTIELRSMTGFQPGPLVSYPHVPFNYALSITGLVVFVIIFAAGISNRKERTPIQKQFVSVLALCIIVASAVALIAGSPLAPRPQWLLRGLLYIWPLYYMLAVACCSNLRLKTLLMIVLVLINCLSLYPYYTMYTRCAAAPALEKLNKITTANDLIVANPWYFYGAIDYYYRGAAQKAGYDKARGWIDIEKLRAGTEPFVTEKIPRGNPPHADGDIYFFGWIDDPGCVKPFTHNKILLYNEATLWEPFDIKNLHGGL